MKQNSSQRVLSDLRTRIKSGAIRANEHVPSARQICAEFGVAIATAHKVLGLLRKEGLVRVVPGVGTIVRAGEREPELSRAAIVRLAIAMADDEGVAALSMRGVARELGVPTMSIYRHVTSKDALVLFMLDAVFAETALPKPKRAWRAELEQIARVQWAGYARHPWLAATLSMTRPQLLPNGMIHTERVLTALARRGKDNETTLRDGITFIAYVRAMAVGLEPEREAERDTGLSSAEYIAENEAAFARYASRFPTLTRLSNGTSEPLTHELLFETGLRYLLDGMTDRGGN